MILDGVAGIKFLASGEFFHFTAVIKAHISFYASLNKTLKKRKILKKEIKFYSTSALYQGSLIIDYFLRKKNPSVK
jgi:hypothetical protein